MEGKKQGFGVETFKACIEKIKEETNLKDVCNSLLLICMFVFYTLTFFVPRFYGLTEKYAGLIVFVMLFVITLFNVNPYEKIRQRDRNFIAVIVLLALTGINILIVKSGFGCFFVMADFALVWYISSEIRFSKWQFYLMGALYTGMLIYWFFGVYTWMFADYTSFAMNTNTAATFTVFSMLCAVVFFESLYDKYRIAGLLITIALVKCLQISLYHRSRGAFIMLLAFCFLRFVIPSRLWEKKGFFYTVCAFATLGSLLFVAFYVWLGTTGVNFRMPFFYKNIFSGREAIWLEFWELFRHKPLTGVGTGVTITSFFEFNVHNAMYNILVIHGMPVFVLMLYLMFGTWGRIHDRIRNNKVVSSSLIALFAVCIESFFDVDLIWVNYSINVLFILLAMNSKYNISE